MSGVAAPMTIDVVVATRDRPEPLLACLAALARQTVVEAVTVYVVDDGSQRPVDEVIPPDLRRQLAVTVLRQEVSRGPAAARNRGVAAGRGDSIAFVDDDVRAVPDLLERHVAMLAAHDGDDLIVGPLTAPPDWRPTPWNEWEAVQVEAEYQRMGRGDYEPTWRQFHTGNAFLARRVFEAVGGFDETFTRAEDVEFALRAVRRGHVVRFNPEAVGWHYAHRSFEAWRGVARAYAEFDARIAELYPDEGWRKVVERERARRHPAVRAMRALGGISGVRPAVAGLVRYASPGLQAAGWDRVTRGLLSICYDLEYEASRRLLPSTLTSTPVSGARAGRMRR